MRFQFLPVNPDGKKRVDRNAHQSDLNELNDWTHIRRQNPSSEHEIQISERSRKDRHSDVSERQIK